MQKSLTYRYACKTLLAREGKQCHPERITRGWAPGSTRERICRGLEFLGVNLDPARNLNPPNGPAQLSAEGGHVAVWRIPTDEERQIAREVVECVG